MDITDRWDVALICCLSDAYYLNLHYAHNNITVAEINGNFFHKNETIQLTIASTDLNFGRLEKFLIRNVAVKFILVRMWIAYAATQQNTDNVHQTRVSAKSTSFQATSKIFML